MQELVSVEEIEILESLPREELMEEYRCALACLCRQSAFMERYLVAMQSGRYVSPRALQKRLRYMEYSKEYLLRTKELLGYTDGLSFMEDVYFQGFQYVGGVLSGDYTLLPQIIAGWLTKAGDKNFVYEVAILITVHYSFQKAEVKRNKNLVLKLWDKVLELIQIAYEQRMERQGN